MKQKEFTIETLPNYTFRTTKISSVELLSLQSVMDFDKLENIKTVYCFILGHLETNIDGKWIKTYDEKFDLYMPRNLEDNGQALQELVMWFVVNVLHPLFQKSDELSQKQAQISEEMK